MVEKFISSARKLSGVVALVAVCALSLVAAAPAAATKCVKPGGGGGCTATIQAAIAAASEGETIAVKPGVYRERVTLNKRVHLRGGGKLPGQVVINGQMINENTVTVSASGVKISNLTVWNAGGSLVLIESGATGVTLSRVILRQTAGACIASFAADTTVIGASLQNCGGDGVYAIGEGFVMRQSSVLVSWSNCMQVYGADAQVVGNLLRACGDMGILISGDSSALVSGNRVLGATRTGITVYSPNATVQGNLVDGAAEYGFDIQSAHPIVSRNTAQNTRNTGFLIGCASSSCAGGQIVGNRAMWNNASGFDLGFEGAAVVSGNVAQGVESTGFYFRYAGPYDVRKNVVKGAGDDCFVIQTGPSTSAVLVDNTADSCRDNGFYVNSGNSTLRANRARNAAFGFRNSIAGTVLENNTATMNSSKFCDENVDAILTGNNFTASVCTY